MLGLFATFFHRLLDRIDAGLAEGSLAATLPDGRARLLGGRVPGPAAVVDLRRWRALLRLAMGGSGWLVRRLVQGRVGQSRSHRLVRTVHAE